MKFSQKLKRAMDELNINQVAVAGMTGKSKASISQYLANNQVPPVDVQREMAAALGLKADYFENDGAETRSSVAVGKHDDFRRMTVTQAARILHTHPSAVSYGLQQGVFPWGYAIKTKNGWTYIINADRFAEIEGVKAQSTTQSTCPSPLKEKEEIQNE